jgi:hypothetical protein
MYNIIYNIIMPKKVNKESDCDDVYETDNETHTKIIITIYHCK